MAARLLQKLTRGRQGRAESSALASSALAFAATLGAATSMQAAFRGYSFRKTGAGAGAGGIRLARGAADADMASKDLVKRPGS